MFGSVVKRRYLLSSDIDVLVVTDLNPGLVLAELWGNGVKEQFEIHVVKHSHWNYTKRDQGCSE